MYFGHKGGTLLIVQKRKCLDLEVGETSSPGCMDILDQELCNHWAAAEDGSFAQILGCELELLWQEWPLTLLWSGVGGSMNSNTQLLIHPNSLLNNLRKYCQTALLSRGGLLAKPDPLGASWSSRMIATRFLINIILEHYNTRIAMYNIFFAFVKYWRRSLSNGDHVLWTVMSKKDEQVCLSHIVAAAAALTPE